MGELKANHEALKLELESSHAEQLQSVKQKYEMSLEGEWTVFDQINETTSILCSWLKLRKKLSLFYLS